MNPIRWLSGYLTDSRKAKLNSPMKILNLTREVVLAHCVEVADHGAARRRGLLGRNSLPPGEGLWIVPCESVHTFGMKFPIDLVYLDRNKKVKKIRNGVPPWRLSACLSAHSVIELASGTVEMTRTKPGDKLEFCLGGTPQGNASHPSLQLSGIPLSNSADVRSAGGRENDQNLVEPELL
jgi:uncharacterized membrane protein (UPF0127 family)